MTTAAQAPVYRPPASSRDDSEDGGPWEELYLHITLFIPLTVSLTVLSVSILRSLFCICVPWGTSKVSANASWHFAECYWLGNMRVCTIQLRQPEFRYSTTSPGNKITHGLAPAGQKSHQRCPHCARSSQRSSMCTASKPFRACTLGRSRA